MNKDIFDFYKKLKQEDIILSFKGNVTSDLLTSVLQIVESKMERLNEPSKVKKKVYNILVEALQNLYHHLEKQDSQEQKGYNTVIFMIGKVDDNYSVFTGNYIKKENVAALKEKLDVINALDKDGLKAYYKEVLNNGMMSDKGGGGLGMIDIARKSKQKLEYDFQEIDDNHCFYSLNIKVAK